MKTNAFNWKTSLSRPEGRVLALAGLMALSTGAVAQSGPQIIRDRCLDCHTERADAEAPFSRISEQRKTPEGWEMTISRMQSLRGLDISADEKRTLIKYLSDNQGLAPAETQGVRYVLEQDRNVVEDLGEQPAAACSGCHSGARVALQRRSQAEWEKLIHFHMGQFPTIELLAGARDHAWFDTAISEKVPALSQAYPLQSKAWSDWHAAPKPGLAGPWRLLGWLPEKGEFDARLSVEQDGTDQYRLVVNGRYADGSPLSGEGRAQVFTGYEWRANLTLDGVKVRQVFAAAEDGQSMEGRMFLRSANELGGQVRAVKEQAGVSRLLAASPGYLKQGEEKTITLQGSNLAGSIDLGKGVEVVEVLSRSADRATVRVRAQADAPVGSRELRVGNAQGATLAVYDRLARVEVTPNDSLARVGGGGGQLDKQKVAYRAVGYAAGADGTPGTEDDLRLGYMPASWSLKPADEAAEHEEDLKYAGTIDPRTGLFVPGDAGPNPARRMSANNVGRLSVVAAVDDGGKAVTGEGPLLVAVQTFIFPVIQ